LEWKFDGNVGTPQKYGAGFVPASGKVKVGKVQLKFGGKAVAEDLEVKCGGEKGATFVLTTTAEPGDAAVTLAAEIDCEGDNSCGRVYLYPM
jgi:hypothetical protein